MKKITRTITSTRVTFQTVVGGEVKEVVAVLPQGINSPDKITKTLLKQYPSGVIVTGTEEICYKYEMPISTFIEHATLSTVEDESENESEEN